MPSIAQQRSLEPGHLEPAFFLRPGPMSFQIWWCGPWVVSEDSMPTPRICVTSVGCGLKPWQNPPWGVLEPQSESSEKLGVVLNLLTIKYHVSMSQLYGGVPYIFSHQTHTLKVSLSLSQRSPRPRLLKSSALRACEGNCGFLGKCGYQYILWS